MIRDSLEETPDQRVLDKKIDFDKETVRNYRFRYNSRHEGSAWSKLPDEEFLVQIGALNDEGEKLRPTAAGLLMFGIERRITREYPEYFLDYREHMVPNIRWTDRIYSQEPEWSGNVFDFYSRVSAKLVLDLKKPFKLVDQVRVDETPQHDAVREAFVNCLVNTDFYQGWSVVIEKYPDRIVMTNPGTIITGRKQMLKGGISQPRNKRLFKMFNLIGLGEHAGSGVPDIFKAWQDAGLDEPVVEEHFGGGNPDRTVLTLPLAVKEKSLAISEKQPEKSPEKQPKLSRKEIIERRIERVLEMIKEVPSISRAEIAKALEISDAQAKTAIEKLKERNKIHREGSDTNGKWIID